MSTILLDILLIWKQIHFFINNNYSGVHFMFIFAQLDSFGARLNRTKRYALTVLQVLIE